MNAHRTHVMFILVLLLVGCSTVLFGQTTIWQADMDEDQSWDWDNEETGIYALGEDITLEYDLFVEEGILLECERFSLTVSGGEDQIVLIGDTEGDAVQIDGAYFLLMEDCLDVTFENTTFTACGTDGANDGPILIIDGNLDEVVIDGCTFSESPDATICLQIDGCDGTVIVSSEFVDLQAAQIECINIRNPGDVVEVNKCHFEDVPGVAIDFKGTGGHTFTIDQNIFFGCEVGIRIGENVPHGDALIKNNIFSDGDNTNGTGHGIVVASDNDTDTDEHPHIWNNAFYDNEGDGINVDVENTGGGGDSLVIRHNVFWENGGDGIEFNFGAGADFTTDVAFRDNAFGENTTAIETDLDPGVGGITYTGLKGDVTDLRINGAAGNANRFAANCVNNDNDNWDLVNENPNGLTYDFHLLVDDMDPSSDINALINAASDGTDPDGSPADIGMYGGRYADENITRFFVLSDDYCWVTDDHIFEIDAALIWDTYRIDDDINAPEVPAGTELSFAEGTIMEFDDQQLNVNGAIDFDGTSVNPIILRGYGVSDWGGLLFDDTTNTDSTLLDYCEIRDAEYGLYFAGVDDLLNDRLDVDNCTIDSCGVGVYINNSRVEITNTTVSNCDMASFSGTGVYMTSSSSGQVILDNCTIENNGIDGTYSSAGITLSSSSPEIINCTIEDNSGAGIACFSSSPDLDAGGTTNNPNTIQSNGGLTQSGSDGAEIYLASSSYPDINYNNIIDYDLGPVGYMIYKHGTSNKGNLDAEDNYWGATPTSSFFYRGSGSAIDYDPYSNTKVTGADDYEIAMEYWEDGEYEDAAYYFERCLNDTGRIGINSVRYLTGCVGEMEDGDFDDLRGLLQEVAEDHRDDRVAWTANRYATHCLTELEDYEDAMDEYNVAREETDNVADSIMAVIDYLSVSELADIDRVDGIVSIHDQMGKLLSQFGDMEKLTEPNLPDEFVISEAYPNPFNSQVHLGFDLPANGEFHLTIHDLQGRTVKQWSKHSSVAGEHKLVWDASDVSSGVYFAELLIRNGQNSYKSSKKLVLLR